MLSPDEIVSKANEWSKKKNVDFETMIVEKESFNVSFEHGEVDQYGSSKDQAVGFRVISSGKEGTSYSESFNEDDVKGAFDEACASSEFVHKNYEPSFVEGSQELNNRAFFSESLAKSSIDEKIEAARKMEDVALKYDSRIKSLPYNGYNDFDAEVKVFNSRGTNTSYRSNACFLFSYALAGDGDKNGMAFEADLKKSVKSLDIDMVAEQSAERALRKLDAQTPTTGYFPIILNPNCASTFVKLLLNHFNLQSVDKKESLFADKLEKAIFSRKITLTDDPFYKGAAGSCPVDSEGTPSQRTTLVENGVLRNFLSNSVFAKKYGYENTANAARSPQSELSIAPTNLVVTTGSNNLIELLNVYPKVILIDALKGLAGVNSISGDFSIQSEGHYYENGQFKHAVHDFVLSGNLVDCLNKIKEIGNDAAIKPSSPVISPSLLISEMSVAGKN